MGQGEKAVIYLGLTTYRSSLGYFEKDPASSEV